MGYYDTRHQPGVHGWGGQKLAAALVGLVGAGLLIAWILTL